MNRYAVLIGVLCAVSATVFSDTLHLKDGTKPEGTVTEEPAAKVTAETGTGGKTYEQSRVEGTEKSAAGAPGSSKGPGEQDGGPADVSVWLIGKHEWDNNGAVIKTARHLLIMDYCWSPRSSLPAKGTTGILGGGKTLVPQEIEKDDVLVFITHNHADHFDPAIRRLPAFVKRVRYIIPEAMKPDFQDAQLRRITTTLKEQETKAIDGVKVQALLAKKGAAGCCYAVEVDGIIVAYVNPCYDGAIEKPEEAARQVKGLLGRRRIDILFTSWRELVFPDENKPRVTISVHGNREEGIEITEAFDKGAPKRKMISMGQKYVYPASKVTPAGDSAEKGRL